MLGDMRIIGICRDSYSRGLALKGAKGDSRAYIGLKV